MRKHDVFVVQEHVCPCSGLAEKCAAAGYSHFVSAISNTHAANVNRWILIQRREENEGEEKQKIQKRNEETSNAEPKEGSTEKNCDSF